MAVWVQQLRDGVGDLWNGGTTRPEPLAPDQERMVQVRRTQVVALLAPLANLAHLVSIAATALLVIPASTGWFRPCWAAAMAAVAVNSVRVWLPRRSLDAEIDALALRGLHAESLAFASLYGLALWRCLPTADAGQSASLIAIVAGVIGAGAIQMSVYRAVAYSWVWLHVTMVAVALIAVGGLVGTVLPIQLVIYGTALSIGITYLSASFERRCRAELAADAEREVVRILLDDVDGGARDWLWELGRDERFHSVSARFARSAGLPADAISEHRPADLLDLLDATSVAGGAEACERLRAAFDLGLPFRDVAVPARVDGRTVWWSWSGRPLRAPLGGGWSGVCSDVTEERHRQAEVLRLATVDDLTGLANRHQFTNELDRWLRAGPMALAILDLDNFKEVNDTLGHPVGDHLLHAVAARVTTALDPSEALCARLGGDEFAILVASDDEATVHARLDGVMASLQERFALAGNHLSISGCLGYARFPTDASSATELLRRADLALYDAKASGRATLRAYTPSIGERADVRATVRQELGHALEQGQLEVWYQPKVRLADTATIGFEALVRWQHPERGMVSPDAFIGVAEETGLIVELGAQVLRDALAALAQLPDHLTMAVNVSAAQLTNPGLAELVGDTLARHGLAARRLVLEITESLLVDDQAVRRLQHLRATGVQVSIDDFGTGYSSFASLRALPLDEVKVDRSFIEALDDDRLLDPALRHDEPGAALVSAILEVAAALSLRTVAEGVETANQARILTAMGCAIGQGYRFARPRPFAEVLTSMGTTGPA